MGFQYTPVASIAMCVQPCPFNQSLISNRFPVIVRYVRVSLLRCPLFPGPLKHAFTFFLCTSRPAHRSWRISISLLLLTLLSHSTSSVGDAPTEVWMNEDSLLRAAGAKSLLASATMRSEERRVGKECRS